MKIKYILIMLVDDNSISEKIILKSLKFLKNAKNKFLFIGDIKKFKLLQKKIFVIDKTSYNLINKKIIFYNVSSKNMSNFKFINKLTNIVIRLLKDNQAKAVINMPINKKKYFKNKFNGFTEFFSSKLNSKNQENMLLFNEKLSVLPLTTHIKIKDVSKSISSKKIKNSILNIFNFYKKFIKKKIKIKVLALNPHAGADFASLTEEKKIIFPTVKKLQSKFNNIDGPISPDTAFINKEEKRTCYVGMYHDQVLTVFKNLFNFEAANITIGLKYLRLSPDHGTGLDLLKRKKKNINNKSFLYCIKFCEKYIKG